MRPNLGKSKVWIYDSPIDMRNGYNGLSGLVTNFGQDVLNGDVYLFLSKDRKKSKAIFFDGSGLNIWMKRMEEGRFANIWLRGEMTISELHLFFEGSSSVVKKLSPRVKNQYAA